jgi:SAM-dependent methyltransferase
MNERSLQEQFDGIDIYLFDQLLKGRFVSGMQVLDAGCGAGRNLVYFLQHGYQVYGVDQSPEAIAQVRLSQPTWLHICRRRIFASSRWNECRSTSSTRVAST